MAIVRGGGLAAWVIILLILTSVADAGGPVVHADPFPAKQAEYVPGEVLVLLSERPAGKGGGAAKNVFKKSAALSRARVTQRADVSPNRCVLRLELPADQSVADAIAERWAKSDPRILAVEPNYIVHTLAAPDDPRFAELWGLHNTGQTGGLPDADIDAVEAWDTTTGSSDVIVAVIDTGIDYLHPDLAPNMWRNPGESGDGRERNGIDDDGNGLIDDVYGADYAQSDGDPMDENNHGTHVAGTIGAYGNDGSGVVGVNWRCRLMACRFLNARGRGTTSAAIDAINYAVAHGAHVLNNSWGGGGFSAALEAAIANARDQGVLFVAAAGNESRDNDAVPFYPAGYNLSNIIAVAATTSTDALASFSNYGLTTVHMAAPGASVFSTIRGTAGNYANAYASFSGTSMATPHVSGVAALLLAAEPGITLTQLRQRIVYTGDPINALTLRTVSGRRLNAFNALLRPTELTVITPRGSETWLSGTTHSIEWFAPDEQDTVSVELLQGGALHTVLAENIPADGTFSWEIPETLPTGSDYRIRIVSATDADESDADFSVVEAREYFTEQFTTTGVASFDLSGKAVTLTPDGAGDYTSCVTEITSLPTHPAGGTPLSLNDDEYDQVSLSGSATVALYGAEFSSFHVGSNGYITFGTGDRTYRESLAAHFAKRRISALFDDLNPDDGGTISSKQLPNRVAVTWENVPEFARSNENTFQIELFFDGRIRIAWLDVAVRDGVVGLSNGTGTPFDLGPSDFSEYTACVLNPPVAAIAIADGDGVQDAVIEIPVSTIIEPDSPPVDGFTLNFSGSDDELELVSFVPGSDLSNWVETRAFDSSEGIVSMQALGTGLIGTTILGTLQVRTAAVGAFTVRLAGGSGAATIIANGIDAAEPGTDTGVVTVTCKEALRIAEPPTPPTQTVCPGSTVTIPISVVGFEIVYQWQKDGVDIPEATGPALRLDDVQAIDAGAYTCVVSDACAGPLVSDAAVLTVDDDADGPVIVRPPSPAASTTCSGRDVHLDVLVNGRNVTYQWKKDGIEIPGETSAALELDNVQLTDGGGYSCEVGDGCGGQLTTSEATLTVVEDVSADAGPDQTMTAGAGVTVGGNPTAGGNALGGTIQWTLQSNPGNAGQISNPSESNPTFTADAAGTYLLQVTVIDATGTCSDDDTMSVTVAPRPAPGGGGGNPPPPPPPPPDPEPAPEPDPEPEPEPEPEPSEPVAPVELDPAGNGSETTDNNGDAVLDDGRTVASVHGLVPGTPVSLAFDEAANTTTLTIGEPGAEMLTVGFSGGAGLEEIAVTASGAGDYAIVFTNGEGSSTTLALASVPTGAIVTVSEDGRSHRTVAVHDPLARVFGVSLEEHGEAGPTTYAIDYGNLASKAAPLDARTLFDESVTISASGPVTGEKFTIALEYSRAVLVGVVEADLRLEVLDENRGAFASAGINDVGIGRPTGNLGDYGIDLVANSAWAVVSRLGTFTVTQSEGEVAGTINEPPTPPVNMTPFCGFGFAPFGLVGMANWLLMFSGLAAIRRYGPRL